MQTKAIQQFVQKQIQQQRTKEEKPKVVQEQTTERRPHKLMRQIKKKILKKPKQIVKQQRQQPKKHKPVKAQENQVDQNYVVYKPNEKIMSRLKHYL
ncbi:unnamed protein product (macronuclear) [Paramecium tetraurelia]|uniref:Uncharacterized protein n=1 Tax=Paramecium tetraurelia TaxID=5888 RepID=A0CXQ1_PARTE|nr:uncharacterized protein GSPATT00011200001 [Paramecium tetraurelia]CAK75568.1 unnamed protein product [Paramecium tetraurelia]|eukprot:XP_001442965.1 hypothetical protein (macronuclear) [Paramecium tetraurelia strain d4-2]